MNKTEEKVRIAPIRVSLTSGGEQLRITMKLLCKILMKRIKLTARRLPGRALGRGGTLGLCGFWCSGVCPVGWRWLQLPGVCSNTLNLLRVFLANARSAIVLIHRGAKAVTEALEREKSLEGTSCTEQRER